MNRGLAITFDTLSTTRNEAAAAVLVDALDSTHETIKEGGLKALLNRRSPTGLRELMQQWHSLSPRFKDFIAENPGKIAGAVRNAVVHADTQICANGCDAALRLREYDLIPALISATEAESNAANAGQAAHTLLRLSQALYEDLTGSRDWGNRRDPQLLRSQISSALERAVGRFQKHKRREILEAFLILTSRSNSTLKSILRVPLDRSHGALVELLINSDRPAVMRLVLSFLDDMRAPGAALNVLAHRGDDEFLRLFARKIGYQPSSAARVNLKRLTKIHWLEHGDSRLVALDDAGQHAIVQVAIYSSISRSDKFAVLDQLLRRGKPGGRRAAVAALSEFQGVEANRLILRALRDQDVHVQAAALGQLRTRGLPGALATLIDALDSRHAVIRKTACESLSEFTFRRYLSAFDTMADEVRESTGNLVRKVDPQTAGLLSAEMKAPSRSRRLRAIEIACTLDMTAELENSLHELLDDDDHMVRVEAATALSQCPTEKTRKALRTSLLDRSVAVRNAAERALQELATAAPRKQAVIDVRTISLPDPGVSATGGALTW